MLIRELEYLMNHESSLKTAFEMHYIPHPYYPPLFFFTVALSLFSLLASVSPVHLILISFMLRKPSCMIASQATAGLQAMSQGSVSGEAMHSSGCMEIQDPGEQDSAEPQPSRGYDWFLHYWEISFNVFVRTIKSGSAQICWIKWQESHTCKSLAAQHNWCIFGHNIS